MPAHFLRLFNAEEYNSHKKQDWRDREREKCVCVCVCVCFPFIFISWRLITLQYCSGFCHTVCVCVCVLKAPDVWVCRRLSVGFLETDSEADIGMQEVY